MNRSRRIATAVAAAALLAPATASADSIVYIDGGNVWSSTPDGTHKVQLTDGGNWHSPTQSDDGTIAAVQGTGPVSLLAGDGRPIGTITTAEAPSGDGGTFAPRPVNLSLSPDGSKLAYAYVANSCPPASTCGTIQRSTFYTRTHTGAADPRELYGEQFGESDPEWVTNDRAVLFGGFGQQVVLDDLGGGNDSYSTWMKPNADQGDGEVSRNGRRLVTTFFYGDDLRLVFFAVNGDVTKDSPPPQPDFVAQSDKDPKLSDPSWSPDGNSVAFADKDGIETLRFTTYEPGNVATDGDYKLLAPAGSEPDWGPADPPAARYSSEPDSGSGDLSVLTKSTSVAALRRGLAVRVVVPAAGKVRAALKRGRAGVSAGSAKASAAGAVTVRLRKVSAAQARRLRGARLTLTVTAGSITRKATVKVGR